MWPTAACTPAAASQRDEVQPVGALGGEGDLPNVATAERQQALDLGERGVAQQSRVVRAAAGLREPGALEVDTVDEPVVGEVGEDRDAPFEVGGRHRHEAREQARGAALVVVAGRGRGGVRVEVGEGGAAAAVTVHVDVTGQRGCR